MDDPVLVFCPFIFSVLYVNIKLSMMWVIKIRAVKPHKTIIHDSVLNSKISWGFVGPFSIAALQMEVLLS